MCLLKCLYELNTLEKVQSVICRSCLLASRGGTDRAAIGQEHSLLLLDKNTVCIHGHAACSSYNSRACTCVKVVLISERRMTTLGATTVSDCRRPSYRFSIKSITDNKTDNSNNVDVASIRLATVETQSKCQWIYCAHTLY